MNLHFITGASRGLGAALADFFVGRGDDVVNISRTSGNKHSKIQHFPLDLQNLTEDSVQKIFDLYKLEKYDLVTLINNAGMIEPIKRTADLDQASITKNITVNLIAPLVLTSHFLKQTQNFSGTRIITHVSSGVASHPIPSWACYSAAKAGLKNFSQGLVQEKAKVISFSPGILDTQMQKEIRSASSSDFPEVEKFISFSKDKKLLNPETVAMAFGIYMLDPGLAPLSEISIQDLMEVK